MHQTLLLLVLTSFFSLSVGQKRVYHFINQSKTWFEAEDFCKNHYTDLATVNDQNNVSSVCPRGEGCAGAWVKLPTSTAQSSATWHWIDLQNTYNPSEITWETTEGGGKGNICAYVKYDSDVLSWHNQPCDKKKDFFCFGPNGSAEEMQPEASWYDALEYCQNSLMSLSSGIGQVRTLKGKANGMSFSWIGLFKLPVGSISDLCPCVKIGEGTLPIKDCTTLRPFICYDDHMVLVKENMTWEEALVYCRRNYGDLAMMTDEHQQRMVQERAKMADTEFVWVGLLYACFFDEWFWVNGHWVSSDDDNWEIRKKRHGCGLSGAMQKNGKWVRKSCNEKYNFVCSVHH